MHITLKNAELLKHSKLIITLRFLTLCASVGNKKGSVLLMHGVTMEFEGYERLPWRKEVHK